MSKVTQEDRQTGAGSRAEFIKLPIWPTTKITRFDLRSSICRRVPGYGISSLSLGKPCPSLGPALPPLLFSVGRCCWRSTMGVRASWGGFVLKGKKPLMMQAVLRGLPAAILARVGRSPAPSGTLGGMGASLARAVRS